MQKICWKFSRSCTTNILTNIKIAYYKFLDNYQDYVPKISRSRATNILTKYWRKYALTASFSTQLILPLQRLIPWEFKDFVKFFYGLSSSTTKMRIFWIEQTAICWIFFLKIILKDQYDNRPWEVDRVEGAYCQQYHHNPLHPHPQHHPLHQRKVVCFVGAKPGWQPDQESHRGSKSWLCRGAQSEVRGLNSLFRETSELAHCGGFWLF